MKFVDDDDDDDDDDERRFYVYVRLRRWRQKYWRLSLWTWNIVYASAPLFVLFYGIRCYLLLMSQPYKACWV